MTTTATPTADAAAPEGESPTADDQVAVLVARDAQLTAQIADHLAQRTSDSEQRRLVRSERHALAQPALANDAIALERLAGLKLEDAAIGERLSLRDAAIEQLTAERSVTRKRLAAARDRARQEEARALLRALGEHLVRFVVPAMRELARRYNEARDTAEAISSRYPDLLGTSANPDILLPGFVLQSHLAGVSPGLARALDLRPVGNVSLQEHARIFADWFGPNLEGNHQ